MEGINEAERIARALAGIPGARTVTHGWPKQSAALPCITVQLAGERGVEHRDDAEYLTETEYYVRVFARTAEDAWDVGQRVRARMEALGYARVFAWESADEQTCQRVERYRITI